MASLHYGQNRSWGIMHLISILRYILDIAYIIKLANYLRDAVVLRYYVTYSINMLTV